MPKVRPEKPVRKKNEEYRIEIYEGYTPEDITKTLMSDYGLEKIPDNARFSVDVNRGDSFCYCEDRCYCSCSCSAEIYLKWTADEYDVEYNARVLAWEKNNAHLDRIVARKLAKSVK